MKKNFYFLSILFILLFFATNVFGIENNNIYDHLSPRLNFLLKDFIGNFKAATDLVPNSISQYTYSHKNIHVDLNIFFTFIEAPDAQTELLADSLIDTLLPSLSNNSMVLDVGSGTGLHTAIIGQFSKMSKKNFKVISFDKIFEASQTTKANVETNNANTKTLIFNGDLFNSLNRVQGKTSLIIANPPMMPSNLNELQKLPPEDIGNLDYAYEAQNGDFLKRKITDGLGLFRKIVSNGAELLDKKGAIAIVTADFLGEHKMKEIFSNAGLDFNIAAQNTRKIRRDGVTWNHMEIIEQLSDYKFFNSKGGKFSSVKRAKESGQDVYHNIKVYVGTRNSSSPIALEQNQTSIIKKLNFNTVELATAIVTRSI